MSERLGESAVARPGPGRPRSETSRSAILDATWELMRERGVSRMSLEGIAAQAGVSKGTIYRWWKTKGLLALDAYEAHFGIMSTTTPDTGSLRGDLLELLRPIVEYAEAQGPEWIWGQVLGEAQYDSDLAAAIYPRLVGPWRNGLMPMVYAAQRRGEIRPGIDVSLVLDTIFGAYYHRLLLHHGALDAAFFEGLVDFVLEGWLRRD